MRYEHLKVSLEDDDSLKFLFGASCKLAQARIPNSIYRAMGISKITALITSNGRICGVAAGHALRRLVMKSLA